jgi:hypothetical protein
VADSRPSKPVRWLVEARWGRISAVSTTSRTRASGSGPPTNALQSRNLVSTRLAVQRSARVTTRRDDDGADTPAVRIVDFDPRAVGIGRLGLDLDPREQVADAGFDVQGLVEGRERGAAGGQDERHGERDIELRLDDMSRILEVGARGGGRCDTDADLGDVRRASRRPGLQRRIENGVQIAAAGIGLQRNAIAQQRLAKTAQHDLAIVSAALIEVEKAVTAFGVGRPGQARLGQPHGRDPVARRKA